MATDTKEALKAAARDEFAEHGIAGARVDRIAKAAGVNKERIYGYFGSKQALFDVVVEESMTQLAESIRLLETDPAEFVAKHYDFYRDNPQVLRLVLWEALSYRDGDLPGTERRREMCRSKLDAFAKGLGAQPSRELAQQMFSLIGMALMPAAMPQLARLLVGDDADEGMREHLMGFARNAINGAHPH
ncbi:MAG TPA: TetR family transcriptional regulator [Stackebrandtia sp.]|jgi:AcrR family transcriptional regulator|uniref:TetR/AcrR family transcriptional regulator n=1 Tax=Stackebrandtia sp. TaxID=2023065 RepID=UPI002D570E49|nr:TetR family transcriptional regulator [Stackebrandtia sp.]HZE39178.1 TetR family transcriptional regulator [Stackebrandtia sp.]